MADIFQVELTRMAQKDLQKMPVYIVEKLLHWVKLVKQEGLQKARLVKSFHDEPLKGTRKGQRSIRLNSAYRAIYCEKFQGKVEFVEIQEVNKHGY